MSRGTPRVSAPSAALLLVVLTGAIASAAEEKPRPQWIGASITAPEFHVRKEVTVPEGVTSARLRVATHLAGAECRLNERVVFVVELFAPWVDVDVTADLRPGVNEIVLRCERLQQESAVLAELTVLLQDGRSLTWPSDATWQARFSDPHGETPTDWRPPDLRGEVMPHLWDVGARSIDITPFDDYEQWRDALGAETAEPSHFLLPENFEIERLRLAGPDEGSWVSCEFDPPGRLLVAREDQGLLRMTLSADGRSIDRVEPVPAAEELKEIRGMAFLGETLYVNANNSKGFYRLRDVDGDGEFDETTLIREFPGSVGHGRNDLAIHNGMIYSIHGDAVDVPTESIRDFTSPFREARRGEKTSEGYLLKYDPEANEWTLIAAGLRNPFGVAVHPRDGTLFTYDADAEHDMGAPWYRPTRIIELQPGADFGWRGVTGRWPPYYPDHADNALPVMDIGKGSPTAVRFGAQSHFPTPYRQALFVLDWAYGRVLAVHLLRQGCGYTGRAEVFLRGRPLNVTDLTFGPDGAMYLVTGGRKTQSALYRVRYTGTEPPGEFAPPLNPVSPRDAGGRTDSQGQGGGADDAPPQAVDTPYVARLSLVSSRTHRPLRGDPHDLTAWRNALERALTEDVERSRIADLILHAPPTTTELEERLHSLLALARQGDSVHRPRLLQRLNEHASPQLTVTQTLLLLRAYALVLRDVTELDPTRLAETRTTLSRLYPDVRPRTFTPLGLGGPINHRLAELLVQLGDPDVIPKTLTLLRDAAEQEDRLHYLFVLRSVAAGWTIDQRQEWFAALNALERDYWGGAGMPAFLKSIRAEAVATLTPEERAALGRVVEPPGTLEDEPLPQRPLVREWSLADLEALASTEAGAGDAVVGRELFRAALCSRCHRCGREGTAVGPDLTGVGGRFNRADLLKSILDPAAVVAEPYRNVEIVTSDGRVLVGQLVPSGDYRERVLRLRTDPLRPTQVVEIPKRDIELHRESRTSPMPAGLLNTLTAEEIRHLLAFLQRGGN
jgi:putative heme-binding domain-containing protein